MLTSRQQQRENRKHRQRADQRTKASPIATLGEQPHAQHQRHCTGIEPQLMRVLANHAGCEQIGSNQLRQIQQVQRTRVRKPQIGRSPNRVRERMPGGQPLNLTQQHATEHGQPDRRDAAHSDAPLGRAPDDEGRLCEQ